MGRGNSGGFKVAFSLLGACLLQKKELTTIVQYPAYKFAFVCHVTADVFFNAVRAGANDMCALLGTSYTWTGSENDIIPEMVNAFKVAINNKVDGIAVAVVDPKAFNDVTDEALSKGIPVVAYNAQAPAGSGSHVMSYIGQDLYQAGVAVGKRILTYVKKGDLVGGMISVPGSLNEQPRMDGAASVFKAGSGNGALVCHRARSRHYSWGIVLVVVLDPLGFCHQRRA